MAVAVQVATGIDKALLILSWARLHLSQFDDRDERGDLLELDSITFKSHIVYKVYKSQNRCCRCTTFVTPHHSLLFFLPWPNHQHSRVIINKRIE